MKKASNLDEAKVSQLIHSIGLKHNLRDHVVRNICEAQFKFANEKIKSLDLEGITEKPDANFYFKYIGKLYINKKK